MRSACKVWMGIALCLIGGTASAQQVEREVAMNNYHRYYNGTPGTDVAKEKSILTYRAFYGKTPYRMQSSAGLTVKECIAQLEADGRFSGLNSRERELIVPDGEKLKYNRDQQAIGLLLTDAFSQIWKIAEEFRNARMTPERDSDVFRKLQQAILYYGKLELGRNNKVSRFHASCFAIPTAAVNTYFCFLSQMDGVESGEEKDATLVATGEMLKALALQAWTQPFRQDETDENVVQIARFRNHVWWVGGNALAYRSLLPVAIMYRSVPMVDLLAEVCQRGISMTSQQTYDEAFWTEGFTADGAGWGHGKQCLVWGYPIDGTIYALNILASLKASPWEKQLDAANKAALFNFFRGSNWYYYKGFIPPCLDRGSMVYTPSASSIRYQKMLEQLLKGFASSFTSEELKELKQLHREATTHLISMKESADGVYNGTRWFFNNDDLIKKNDRYQVLVNMASVRCDGLESATNMADEYNFYTADGLTLFQKSGDEYRKVIGAADVTASPGVTAREGMDALVPVTNWRGYCSRHNFAAGATRGRENAVAGFIFEKMNASAKDNVNDRGNNDGKNELLYGVKAHKSYFILGDYVVALGAGITNLKPELTGTIRTTIDQTAHEAPVYLLRNGKKLEVEKEKVQALASTKKSPVWLMQEGKFAYTVLPAYTDQAFVVCETRRTDWMKRNSSNQTKKGLPETSDLLRVWIDHGQQPTNDTYGYAVYAGEGAPQGALPFQVLRNDTLVQAVQTTDSRVTEAVFYNASVTLKLAGGSLSVSAPCALLIEQQGDSCFITVADAEMDKNRNEIVVTWKGKQIPVTMPQGQECGKPATVTSMY